MIEATKKKFCQYLRSLEYNVDDNGNYREEFPWLMLSVGSARVLKSYDLNMTEIQLKVDIFSTYTGEKEILTIVDNINKHIRTFMDENAEIQYVYMRSLRIIDDRETGPVRKHGVAQFSFVVAQEDISDGE